MIIARLGVLFLLVSYSASLQAGKWYPFDADEDLLAPAAEFQPWAEMLARHESQRADISACDQPGSRCRGRFRSYQRMLERASELSRAEKTELANFYINRTRYDDDFPQRIYDEDGHRIGVRRTTWMTLFEFQSRVSLLSWWMPESCHPLPE